MSQGPGRVQQAIWEVFRTEPDNAFTTEELCRRVYGIRTVKRKHRFAVTRAAKRLGGHDAWYADMHLFAYCAGTHMGCRLVFYNPSNLMSYAMAQLKAHEDYGNNDPRVNRPRPSEADLRAKLRSAAHRRLLAEGGAWRSR